MKRHVVHHCCILASDRRRGRAEERIRERAYDSTSTWGWLPLQNTNLWPQQWAWPCSRLMVYISAADPQTLQGGPTPTPTSHYSFMVPCWWGHTYWTCAQLPYNPTHWGADVWTHLLIPNPSHWGADLCTNLLIPNPTHWGADLWTSLLIGVTYALHWALCFPPAAFH